MWPKTRPQTKKVAMSIVRTIFSCTLVIRRFLKEHETEINVGVYDLAVGHAIDPVAARLHKADKDLETLRNEVSCKEEPAKLGR